jgi:hypothetical protein
MDIISKMDQKPHPVRSAYISGPQDSEWLLKYYYYYNVVGLILMPKYCLRLQANYGSKVNTKRETTINIMNWKQMLHICMLPCVMVLAEPDHYAYGMSLSILKISCRRAMKLTYCGTFTQSKNRGARETAITR